MSMFDDLWVEKYRPKTLDDLVLTPSNRQLLGKLTGEESIPNLLFVGKPGIGKTSLAKIIVNDLLECQYLYINASDENGIDTIRNKVTNFSKIKSLDGGVKVIILDEVDGLTMDAQRALRNTMEEYCQYVRFVLTANYNHKVIPALQSRCQSFDLTPDETIFTQRIEHVLSQEQIDYNVDTEFKSLTKKFFPDFRRCINEVQKMSISGKLSTVSKEQTGDFVKNLFFLLQKNKAFEARKYVIKNETVFSSDYQNLLRDLFDSVDQMSLDIGKKREMLLIISEHMYRSAFVLDQEINFYSCLLAISKVI